MKKIKTFEDACKKLGKDPSEKYTSSEKNRYYYSSYCW